MKSTAISKNRHCEGKYKFDNHWSKVDTELNSNFTDIFFLKYVTKIFHFPYYFQKNIWECFKVDLSVVVSVYFIKDFGKQATEAEVLKCISKNSLSEKLLKF